jgi:hypothetical protein
MRRLMMSLVVVFAVSLAVRPVAATEDDEHGDRSCAEECGASAYASLRACVEKGGDEAECMVGAQAQFTGCLGECKDEPESSCEDRCHRRAEEAHAACIEEHGKEEGDVCDALSDDVKERCLDEECHAPAPGCNDHCQEGAEETFAACMNVEGDGASCARSGEQFRTECMEQDCPDDGEGNDGDSCPDRCDEAAAAKVEACIAEGEDPERCAARGAEAVRHCVEEHCDDDDAPHATCEERCEEYAQAEFRRCVDAGGVEADCRVATDEAFAGCVRLHCEIDEGCAAKCERKASRIERRCVRRGGDAAGCANDAGAFQQTCEDDRCAPPPPTSCAVACEAQGAAVKASCLANGLDDAQCDAVAQGAVEECVASCGAAPDPTCSEQCEDSADERYDDVTGQGGDEERGIRRAQKTFRHCHRSCDE